MGASLRAYPLGGAASAASVMTPVKLGLHPVVMALLVRLFGVEGIWAQCAILCAGMPMGVNTYLFAVRYRLGEAEVTTAILLSNMLSMLSLGVVLQLIGVG